MEPMTSFVMVAGEILSGPKAPETLCDMPNTQQRNKVLKSYYLNLRFNGQKVGWIVGKKALMDKKWGKKAVVRLVKRLSDSSLL